MAGIGTGISLIQAFDSKLKSALNGKLAKPSTAGTSGQVLVSDGNGGQAWGDIVEGEFVIDPSLSVSGAAADAKATGTVKNTLENVDGVNVINFTQGYYITTNGEVGSTVNLNSPTSSATGLAYAIDSCQPGDVYTISGTGASSGRLWAFIDSNNLLLSKANNSITMNNGMVIAPANAAKIVINAKNAFAIKGKYVCKRIEMLEEKVTPPKTNFFLLSSNIFDGTVVTGRLNNSGVVDATETDYRTTDYIDIHGNDGKYIRSEQTSGGMARWGIAFYDWNKTFIEGNNGSATTAKQIPSGAYYVRITISNGTYTAPFIGISNDSDEMSYEPFYQEMNPSFLPQSAQNWYKGKKISALGDSITANGNYIKNDSTHSAWRQIVYEKLLLSGVVVNNGIGGTRVSGSNENAMWQDARIEAIALDSDVVLFNGGMNDWVGNAEIGTISSTDTDTFMGALNVIAQKLLTRFPAKRIFWMTTTYGTKESDLNTLNLTTRDYADAIRTVAKRYGFPVIDLAADCGWNEYNYATYLNAEDGTYIHPNRTGGQRIAEVIIGNLLKYQPVALDPSET